MSAGEGGSTGLTAHSNASASIVCRLEASHGPHTFPVRRRGGTVATAIVPGQAFTYAELTMPRCVQFWYARTNAFGNVSGCLSVPDNPLAGQTRAKVAGKAMEPANRPAVARHIQLCLKDVDARASPKDPSNHRASMSRRGIDNDFWALTLVTV
jgi:hypothetical protein